jgi:hypothetical protein
VWTMHWIASIRQNETDSCLSTRDLRMMQIEEIKGIDVVSYFS